jgi:hypothetical protein
MKKRIDITGLVYALIMIIVFAISSCKSSKPVIPAPKYTPSFYNEVPNVSDEFMGLKISNYQSSIDTSFNYLDDAIEVFGTPSL